MNFETLARKIKPARQQFLRHLGNEIIATFANPGKRLECSELDECDDGIAC